MVAQFGVLGPVQITVGGTDVPVGGPKQRCVMGLLLLEPGRVVPTSRIAEAVWGADRPVEMTNALQAAVSRLRRVLSTRTDARLVSRADGYQLDVDEDQVDVHRARRLTAAARAGAAAGAEERATRLFEQALSLWRGRPFANVESALVQDRLVPQLELEYLGTVVESHDCALRMGHGARLIPQLSRLVEEHPFEQRLRSQLLIALYVAGRTVEALREYYRLRTVLVDELGIEPDEDLRRMHQAILRGVPASDLLRAHVPGAPVPPAVAVPSRLPPATDVLVGREAQVRQLTEWFGDSYGRPATAVLTGPPGAGKTALALHVARALGHRRFPDGQLYAGLDAAQNDPVGVLSSFLVELGVAPVDVPRRWDECVTRFRDLVAGRRILAVLDGVGDAASIARLLTAVEGCGVLLTTSGNVPDRPGALRIELDGLDREPSVRALAVIAGADRVADEPDVAAEVARLCAYNPRAIGIVGAALRTRRRVGMTDVVRSLGALQRTAPNGSMYSFAAVSYAEQPRAVRRLFRLLDMFDLPPVTARSLALVFGPAEPDVEQTLELLIRTRLVEAVGGSDETRYHIPAGVRSFARWHQDSDVDDAELVGLAGRMVRSWLSTVADSGHQDQPCS